MNWIKRLLRRKPAEPEYLTLEEVMDRHPELFKYEAPSDGHRILVIERDPTVYTYWESWRHWKFGKRAPEHVYFKDVEAQTHKEAR